MSVLLMEETRVPKITTDLPPPPSPQPPLPPPPSSSSSSAAATALPSLYACIYIVFQNSEESS